MLNSSRRKQVVLVSPRPALPSDSQEVLMQGPWDRCMGVRGIVGEVKLVNKWADCLTLGSVSSFLQLQCKYARTHVPL
jgi:hypothetical protein